MAQAVYPLTTLGQSDLKVGPICLGTMTFAEQVDQATAFDIMSCALEAGVGFWDTAEMYAVPAKAETCGATETMMGNWFKANPGKRDQVVLATKVAGPSRGMPWIRGDNSGLTSKEIVTACDNSLKRLQTDVIDLYQIHWPARNAPLFGQVYFDPSKDKPCASILEQLHAMEQLVRAGKIKAIGLSNETAYGVHEFVRLAEQHGLPRIATVQNAYHLLNRSVENGLDETMHRLNVSLLAYSPLAFGLLTGKYDDLGIEHGGTPQGRMAIYASMRAQRWGRPQSVAGAKRYNALAKELGLTPTQLALAFCKAKWQVASTIIGVTNVAQLQENIAAFEMDIAAEVLAMLDAMRVELGDPAI
jgi:aryl-alcohol dehydrogenase-like predicted oxidoreductase